MKKIEKYRFWQKVNRTNQAEENENYIGNHSKRTRLMGINRYIAKRKVYTGVYIAICVIVLLVYLYILNIIENFSFKKYLGEETDFIPKSILETLLAHPFLNIILILIAIIGYIRFAYLIEVAFADLNVGQKGTSRWTTDSEIQSQYKAIELTPFISTENTIGKEYTSFNGYGGIPISRINNKMYIDDSNTHTCVVGTTRSGKDQTILAPMIENLSRAESKCSMILTDPKLEQATLSIPMLESRGYECYIVNFLDPLYSSGYNPLKLIVDEYNYGIFKGGGNTSVAQTLAVSVSHTLMPKNEHETQPFFSNAARDLFVATLWCMMEDAYEDDRVYNIRAKVEHEKQEIENEITFYKKLYGEDYYAFAFRNKCNEMIDDYLPDEGINYEVIYYRLKNHTESIGKILSENITVESIKNNYENFKLKKDRYIKKPYIEKNYAKDKINIYNLVQFVSTLNSKELLDDYFTSRDAYDFGRLKYASVQSAGSKAKGDIISTFFEKLSTFLTLDIAKITAKSTFELAEVGFGKKPVAIFISEPDYDKSTDFIATLFINQLYFVLAKLASATSEGKVARRTHFLLNEIGNFPPIENLPTYLKVGAGRDLIFHLFIQDFASLNSKYKDEADSIVSNCGNLVFIKAGDNDTTSEIEQKLGSETIINVNRTGKKLSLHKELTESTDERKLLTARELEELKKGENIVLRTMKREDLEGNSIQASPIANLGDKRFYYAYEFLGDVLSFRTRLYCSPTYERILSLNDDFKSDNITYSDVKLDTTENIKLEQFKISTKNTEFKLLNLNSGILPLDKISLEALQIIEHINKNILNKAIIERKNIDEETGEITVTHAYSILKLYEISLKLMKQGDFNLKLVGLDLYNFIYNKKWM